MVCYRTSEDACFVLEQLLYDVIKAVGVHCIRANGTSSLLVSIIFLLLNCYSSRCQIQEKNKISIQFAVNYDRINITESILLFNELVIHTYISQVLLRSSVTSCFEARVLILKDQRLPEAYSID